MERRLIRLEQRVGRGWLEQVRQRGCRDEPVDWRLVPAAHPACFAALTESERLEWGELTAQYHEPGAWPRRKDDRGFFRRLAELDNMVDWYASEGSRGQA